MPRSSLVPKYCLHKPSGRAYVRIHGKVIYTGDYGTAESKQKYGRLIAELAVNPLPRSKIPGEITVTEVCDFYWEHAQRYYCKNGKPSGWLAHIRLMLRKLRKTYGMTSAADFGPLKLKAIRQTLIDAGHKPELCQ